MRMLLAGSLVAAGLVALPMPAQALSWQPCQGEFECANLKVPLDRTKPQGKTTTLRLIRHRATGSDRIGSLVFNPGGPGGSGVASIGGIWKVVPDPVKARFDLVTWDPRGINTSTPNLSDCRGAQLELPPTGPVKWKAVTQSYAQDIGKANRACQKKHRKIVAHIGTNSNVADLEEIRKAIGDEKLTYWGLSYGTRIGYVYALTHPDKVRSMVLDGSIDPASSILGLGESGVGPDQAFGSFTDAYPTARRQYNDLITRLNQQVVRLPGKQVLDRWILRDIVFNPISQQSLYDPVAAFLANAHAAVIEEQPAARKRLAASLKAQRAKVADDSGNGGVFAVTNCTDYQQRPTVAEAMPLIRQQVALGPNYAGQLSIQYVMQCAGLQTSNDPVPLITGRGSNLPLLILGSSRDGSTINSWTARMSRAFPRSRTVTYAGGQHVTWGLAGSECVDSVANTYVLTGDLPRMDVGCSNAVSRG